MSQLRVYFLPELASADELNGAACAVIDVLRATTTMVYALAAGARAVVPCLSIGDAHAAIARLAEGTALLGGERGGLPIEGFDLGNSPGEYTAEVIAGKTVALSTTNGTKALLQCRAARRIVIAAWANLSAVCTALAAEPSVAVVCAGTDGRITFEDVLVAGALVDRLEADGLEPANDQALIAVGAWRELSWGDAAALPQRLERAMRASLGGRNLVEIGMEHDIRLAAQIDQFAIVPVYDAESGQIVIE